MMWIWSLKDKTCEHIFIVTIQFSKDNSKFQFWCKHGFYFSMQYFTSLSRNQIFPMHDLALNSMLGCKSILGEKILPTFHFNSIH